MLFSSALGLAALVGLSPQAARADNECGVGAEVTCATAGNPYANGIFYVPAGNQTIHFQSGVIVNPPASSFQNGLVVVSGSPTGAIVIDAPTNVSFTANASGANGLLLATNAGAITANVATVVVNGDSGAGILGSSADGAVTLTAGSVTTRGANSIGIDAGTDTGAVVVSATTVSTSGSGSTGVRVASDFAPVRATVGTVTTTGANATGVSAAAGGLTGTAMVTNNTLVSTTGASSVGIRATAASGAVTVASNRIQTTGSAASGIIAASNSGLTTVTSTSIQTAGTGADGIDVRTGNIFFAGSGAVNVTSGAITTTGASAAGVRINTGGAVTITGSGAISTTGATAPGITARSVSGPLTATLNGAVSSATNIGADLNGQAVTVTIGSGGSVNGATAGLNLTSVTGSVVTQGGVVGSSGGFAIAATGGAATIANTGTINGAVRLTANADTLNNAGVFEATKNSDFGAGADVFNNSGDFNVLSGAVPVGTVTLTGLETFQNTGTVSLANGRAGDSLVLPGVFNGGAGSRLDLDVAFAGGTAVADTLVVGSATGSTGITVFNSGGGVLTNGVLLVDAGAATPSTAFVLDPASVDLGMVRYDLVFDAATNNFSLVGTPGQIAYETLKIGEFSQAFWRRTADAWSNHMTSVRDARWAGDTVSDGAWGWGQFFGGSGERGQQRTFTSFGVTQASDLTYQDDYRGFQGGVDMVRGPWVAGVTAGYAGSESRFDQSNNSVDLVGYNLGAYAGFAAGGWFANGLVKYDAADADFASAASLYYQDFDVRSWGAQLETGYRFGSAYFIEPVASIAWVRSDIDNLTGPNSSFEIDEGESVLGKVGLRAGAAMDMPSGGRLAPYAAVYAVEEFAGDNGVTFVNGGFSLPFENQPTDTYGQATLGVDIASVGGFNGFAQVDADFGEDVEGYSARLGFRFSF